jgi:hypothetical protein
LSFNCAIRRQDCNDAGDGSRLGRAEPSISIAHLERKIYFNLAELVLVWLSSIESLATRDVHPLGLPVDRYIDLDI